MNKQEYLEKIHDISLSIYYARIVMNDNVVKEALEKLCLQIRRGWDDEEKDIGSDSH